MRSLLLVLAVATLAAASAVVPAPSDTLDGAERPSATEPVALAPLAFAPTGAGDAARLTSIGPGARADFAEGEVRLVAPGAAVALRFAGEGADARPEGASGAGAEVHRLVGPASAHASLPAFQEVVYRGAWPGVDVVFRAGAGPLKYDVLVAPGADASRVAFDVVGATDVSLDATGDLRIGTAAGDLVDEAPIAWQTRPDGVREPVEAAFALAPAETEGVVRVSFALGPYDPARPLVIDPTLAWGASIGGADEDAGTHLVALADGSVLVVGATFSADLPATAGVLGPSNAGGWDGFVAKLSPSGALAFATYLGGTGTDSVADVAVADDGSILVGGSTTSTDLPVTPGAFQTTKSIGTDVFVAKLASDGASLSWATFYGGGCEDYATAFGADADGRAVVAGLTCSADLPLASAFDATKGSTWDSYVSVFDAAGATLVHATFLGGSGYDHAHDLAVGPEGTAYVVGRTSSLDFPLANAFQSSHSGGWDVFLAAVAPDGTLSFGGYLGGSMAEFPEGISADASGVHVTGFTFSSDFPSVASSAAPAGGGDVFVASFAASGAPSLVTRFGGSGDDTGTGIGTDALGRLHVAGVTRSVEGTGFPLVGAFDTTFSEGDPGEGFVTSLSPSGDLQFSSYLGGSALDSARDLAVGADGSVFVAGITMSADFPLAPASGGIDTFVVKLDVAPASLVVGLDILPGSDENPLRPDARGVIPVAILSTAGLDAPQDVDRASLTFGRTGDEPSLRMCPGVGTDVNGDGLLDLVCHFDARAAGFREGDTSGTLQGLLVAGGPIAGSDLVWVLG